MINQLRIYEIFDENAEAFLDRFRDHAARLMARHGFRILAMWESADDGRRAFVYLLAWRDEAEMDDCWSAFMADPEWIEIKRVTAAEHGAMVGGIESHTLRPVAFSRALGPDDG